MPKNVVDKFTTHLKNVMTKALILASELKHAQVSPDHLLWAAATESGSVGSEILKKANFKADILKTLIIKSSENAQKTRTHHATPELSEESKRIIEKTVLTASIYENSHIGTEHLIAGILQVNNKVITKFLENTKVDILGIRKQLTIVLKGSAQFPNSDTPPDQLPNRKKDIDPMLDITIDDVYQPNAIQTLEYFATELTTTESLKNLDPLIGREEEITRMMQILSRRSKNNPILIGEPGVGKTAIVEEKKKKIIEKTAPDNLIHKRIFSLDVSSLVAGTMYRGEFENRIRQIIDELKDHPEVILFIDEIHTIMGAGASSGSLDAANILKPALSRGQIRCIGATTPTEYKKHIETDGALERRFQAVQIQEPTQQDTVKILKGLTKAYEDFHNVEIDENAITYAVAASNQFIHNAFLPDKAIDLIDEASASLTIKQTSSKEQTLTKLSKELEKINVEKQKAIIEERYLDASVFQEKQSRLTKEQKQLKALKQPKLGTITQKDIAQVLEKKTGIKISSLESHERTHLKNIEKTLNKLIFGQKEAVKQIATHIRRAKVGINRQSRPLASFLLTGPSGTGKSELAIQLAKYIFQNDTSLIRIDMSEYKEPHSISKLIGSPAGYVGYRETSMLTDAVKQKPHSVVLFDEIEKSHKDIHNLLLQILERGELKDSTGRTISFKNTIVILTSNTGSEKLLNGKLGFKKGEKTSQEEITNLLKDTIRPEIIHRLDQVCTFNQLQNKDLLSIAEKELNALKDSVSQQGKTLFWSTTTKKHLVNASDSKTAGARNIKHKVNELIASKIADEIIKNPKSKEFHININNNNIDLEAKTR